MLVPDQVIPHLLLSARRRIVPASSSCVSGRCSAHPSHSRTSTHFPGVSGHLLEQEISPLLGLALFPPCQVCALNSVFCFKPDWLTSKGQPVPLSFPARTLCQAVTWPPVLRRACPRSSLCSGCAHILLMLISELPFCKQRLRGPG